MNYTLGVVLGLFMGIGALVVASRVLALDLAGERARPSHTWTSPAFSSSAALPPR